MKIKRRLTKQLLTLTKALTLMLGVGSIVPTHADTEPTVYTDFASFCDGITNGDEYITLQLEGDIIWNVAIPTSGSSGPNTANLIEVNFIGNIGEGEALYGIDDSYYSISTTSSSSWFAIQDSTANFLNILLDNFSGSNSTFTFKNTSLSISNSIFSELSVFTLGSGAISANESEVTIDDSLFVNNTVASNGGAVYVHNFSTLTISNSIFDSNSTTQSYNTAGSGGGAISIYGSDATIDGTTFSNNSSYMMGGAICNAYSAGEAISSGTVVANSSTLELSNSFFTDNIASDEGGAIYNYKSTLTIDNTEFTNNSAGTNGGAITNYWICTATITNSVFTSNEASQGGAFYNNYMGTTIIENCTINDNQADNGGAIYNTLLSKIYVYDSSFSDNYANDYGGAIYNTYGTLSGTKYASYAYIYDTSFIGNEAGIAGGAIYNDYSYLYIYAEEADVTFSGNTAGESGGAIYNVEGIVYLYAQTADIIFSGNTANGVSNAITQASDSSTKLYAYSDTEGEGRIVFDDAITGVGYLAINTSTGARGTVVLNADMSDFTGTTAFYWGTLSVGADMGVDESTGYTNFFGGTFTTGNSDYSYSATIDAANGVLDCFDTSQWTTNTELSVCIDVSIDSLSADFFDLTGDSLDVNISELNILDEALVTEIKIAVANANEGFSLSADQYEIVTDNYTYTITDEYMDGTYYLIMSSTENIPEPSTATLSLLALAALCARRRRKTQA